MKHAYSCLLMIFAMGFITACGEKGRTATPAAYTSTLLEKQCMKGDVKQEKVTTEIEALYNKVAAQAAWVFFSVPERNFDYKNPLSINLNQLAQRLRLLKSRSKDLDFNDQSNRDVTFPVSNEIFNLYQDAIRYEGSKCQLRYLSTKKVNDITPYMTLKDYCLSKSEDEFCSTDVLSNLADTEALFVKENAVKMCVQLTGDEKNCQMTYHPESVASTQKLFREKKFNKLFQLKDSHLKFQCEKTDTNVTMKIKVHSPKMNLGELKNILDAVTTAWSREDFKMTFNIVDTKGEDVIEIIPTPRPVSFVMEQNNRLVYLSSLLNLVTKRTIMVHEFGHVLGFPDCYTEYYDSEKKSLIYYEISKDNKNIMCSMKSGVSVPSDYLDQLVQKSCLFSQK